jgi:hypothetical protein
MAPPDDSRCRGADEPQAPVHSISILSEHAILPSDVFTDSLPHPSFAANTFKAKILEVCQKNDLTAVIIYFFEALTLLE